MKGKGQGTRNEGQGARGEGRGLGEHGVVVGASRREGKG